MVAEQHPQDPNPLLTPSREERAALAAGRGGGRSVGEHPPSAVPHREMKMLFSFSSEIDAEVRTHFLAQLAEIKICCSLLFIVGCLLC